MDGKLTFRYDQVGDILYVDTCLPYAEQESEEVGEEIIARLNPTSGEVENLEILFFSKRMAETSQFELPIAAAMRLAG
jgi:uncharacterized protein YuzE